jgi:hypothetical protein
MRFRIFGGGLALEVLGLASGDWLLLGLIDFFEVGGDTHNVCWRLSHLSKSMGFKTWVNRHGYLGVC